MADVPEVMAALDRAKALEAEAAAAGAKDAVAEQAVADGPRDEATAQGLLDRATGARDDLAASAAARHGLSVELAQKRARLAQLRRA